jgi:hypothetical protein
MGVIVLAKYLGNYGLVTPIITLGANNSGPFPFEAHLRWAHDLLPPTTQASIPPFEQLLDKGTYFL